MTFRSHDDIWDSSGGRFESRTASNLLVPTKTACIDSLDDQPGQRKAIRVSHTL